MKSYIVYLFMILFSLSTYAQIDSRNKSFSIPAVEAPKDTADLKPQTPDIKAEPDLNLPKPTPNLPFPKKEFSMFSDEEFGDPGELYADKINKTLDHLKLSKEEMEMRNGSTVDQFLGDFKSSALFVNVVYRDHGYMDGDVIQVRVNDDVVHARVFLTNSFKGFKLDLMPGINKIDFVALNQGESGPNTAEFRVVDDTGAVVTHNQWNLATGVKATIIVFKE
ncbi:hypothetical protein Q4566_04870 [Tamlana sp. 2_MG-2023]|uniref:hypothetical protein n=1 Tax=unclassified Tamlana TaxID=2614803 RepID=UPI0026E1F92C|nr:MULTISPECIES: hypothetical protein [unclassified Tamlana]MDO6759525.1 hypothetical protein [Tamlana sp. 2_MG-2023]MDO6790336.1 hypothetical protein [Tamlana sp. 1_MG-2023]